MIKPLVLKPGDTIGIIAPSWGGPGAVPHRLEQGMRQIEEMGFRALIAPNARNQNGYVSDTPENRAADINAMFANPDVHMILSAIGGDHSCHLLPLLDYHLMRLNPKIFMGFSDTSVLNNAIHQATGLVTFNGPALLTDFAEYPHMYPYTRGYFEKTVCQAQPVGQVEPAEAWTEEFLDWEQKLDQTRPRKLNPSPGWTWLKPGQARGRLLGGCIESLQHLRGTPYWPNWQGALFFFETSEEKPTPADIDGILMDYENMGVLEQISGMLVGRPMYYNEAEKEQLRQIVSERTRKYEFPIITDMDFGHTAPQFTLPIGCYAGIDSEREEFAILEAAVIESAPVAE
jgi:muramoyltetrapeptide carboxypeptidase